MAPVPDGGLIFSSDGKVATLVMKNVPIVDQPKWPAIDAGTSRGFMDFKLVMKAGDEPVKYENPKEWYRFTGFKAIAQLEATIRVPSLKFEFKTDPLEKSSASFAVMGEEVNGKYYS